MANTSISVLIITHNNVKNIDQTMESIQMQDFPKEKVWTYIVDFDSTDGTYEKVLSYDRYHTAVYQIPDVYNERARVSRAAEVMQSHANPSAFQYIVSLCPGDILYEHCFTACVQALKKYRMSGASLLICEADIIEQNGTIRKQRPIAEKELLLSPNKIAGIMLERFWDHYVGYFGGSLYTSFHREYCLGNERYSWNKLTFSTDTTKEFVYLPQRLFALRERNYNDEVEDLLLQWEARISLMRKRHLQDGLKSALSSAQANRSLANYSLWRVSKRYPELSPKEREDMLYLADIIDPTISGTEIYRELWGKIINGLNVKYLDYKAYWEGCSYGSTAEMSNLWEPCKECN